jgi:predicted nucleic acid-binding protein
VICKVHANSDQSCVLEDAVGEDVDVEDATTGAGVRCLLTEDLQDGFILQSVKFVNPFKRANDRLIDEILPPGAARR